MKTCVIKPEQINRRWYLIDAEAKVLGRIASAIVKILEGKHKAIYTPHIDTGDYVVVINADRIKVTGNKLNDKLYSRYSGYPGGLKTSTLGMMLKDKPTEVLLHAVKGMLPKSSLGRQMLGKLKIYAGNKHPHIAQKLEGVKI